VEERIKEMSQGYLNFNRRLLQSGIDRGEFEGTNVEGRLLIWDSPLLGGGIDDGIVVEKTGSLTDLNGQPFFGFYGSRARDTDYAEVHGEAGHYGLGGRATGGGLLAHAAYILAACRPVGGFSGPEKNDRRRHGYFRRLGRAVRAREFGGVIIYFENAWRR